MGRLPAMALSEMSEEQRAVYDRIVSGPRGHIGGPHWPWLRSPKLAEAAQRFGQFCRFETRLEPLLIEIAILVTATHWRARLEWDLHAPVAKRLGLSDVEIDCIRVGGNSGFSDPARRAALNFCRELVCERGASQGSYADLVSQIGAEATVELVGILGYYALISMTIIAFEVPSTSDGDDPFGDVR